MEVELVDLRDYPMPFFEEVASPAYAAPANEVARKWAAKVDSLDGYIFVTAEYNRAPSGVLKNALDYAYNEFNRKPASYVGYGGVGGARAVEQLRLINVELQMAPTRSGVHIAGADFMGLWQQGKSFEEMPHLAQSAGVMLDELSWWAKALKTAREASARSQRPRKGSQRCLMAGLSLWPEQLPATCYRVVAASRLCLRTGRRTTRQASSRAIIPA